VQTLNRADRKFKIAFESGCQKESENEFLLDSYQEGLYPLLLNNELTYLGLLLERYINIPSKLNIKTATPIAINR
jgi:hypothetical protein